MSIILNGKTIAGAPPPSDTADAAKKADLTSIIATGATNATGATIASGTYFYLNGSLVVAKADIASGASFTENTNYEAVTAGGLNSLKSALDNSAPKNIALTAQNSATLKSGMKLEYKNGICILQVDIAVYSSATWTTVATFDQAYAPTDGIYFFASKVTSIAMQPFYIGNDGTIQSFSSVSERLNGTVAWLKKQSI